MVKQERHLGKPFGSFWSSKTALSTFLGLIAAKLSPKRHF
jgi:hypothetical protein